MYNLKTKKTIMSTIKNETNNSMNRKYFILYICYDADKIYANTIRGFLKEMDYGSMKKLIEEEGESPFYDALTTSYLTDVNEIIVKESETMPTSYFYNSELKKVGKYYRANYNREHPGISPKGLVVYQHNTDLVNVFAIEVTKSERFDGSKLYITDGGNTIIYDNNHYKAVDYSGDEEGSLKVYKNGKLLNI